MFILFNFIAQLVTDLSDTLFSSTPLYRRMTGDTWSLILPINTVHPLQPFWTRGIPKPASNFHLLSVQYALTSFRPVDFAQFHKEAL